MGTRHLVAVVLDGQYKVAQYGQWDGYPSGQGSTVLEFLKTCDRPAFEGKLRATAFMTADDVAAFNAMIKAERIEGIEGSWQKRFPELTRDTGAEILGLIANAEPGMKLVNSIDFAADSLFCEFAYVLDLDANTLEVYTGFNKEPLNDGDRFYGATNKESRNDYHPIKKVASYSLDALPTVEMMDLACEEQSDDELTH